MDIQVRRGSPQPEPPPRGPSPAMAAKLAVAVVLALAAGKLWRTTAHDRRRAEPAPVPATAAAPQAASSLPVAQEEPRAERPDLSSLLVPEEEMARAPAASASPQPRRQQQAAAALPKSTPSEPEGGTSAQFAETPPAREMRRGEFGSRNPGGAALGQGAPGGSSGAAFRADVRRIAANPAGGAGGLSSASGIAPARGYKSGTAGRLPPSQWPTVQQLREAFSRDAKLLGPLPASPGALGGSGNSFSGRTGASQPSQSQDDQQGGETQNLGGGAYGGTTRASTPSADSSLPTPGPSPIPWHANPQDTGLIYPDVSVWRPVNDWDALSKASAGIIEMKVRQVSIDALYHTDVSAAEDHKMIVIGYAFGYNASGADQADALVVNFPPKPGRILMLDLERNPYGNSMTDSQAVAFVERIKARTGQYPLLYASESHARPGALADCPRYIAVWGPSKPPAGAKIWQFTDGVVGMSPHSFPGVGSCDINKTVITYAELRKMAGL